MMAEDTGGDIENPDPKPPVATATSPPPKHNPYGGANPNDPNKKFKVIVLSTFLFLVVVLAIALGVAFGNDSSSSSESANVNTGKESETGIIDGGAICLMGDITYGEGEFTGFDDVEVECINSTTYDGLASTCGSDGQFFEMEQQFTCGESAPFCVQCGPRGRGAARCSTAGTTGDADCGDGDEGQPITITTTSPDTTAAPPSTNVPPEEEDPTAPQVYKSQYFTSNGPIQSQVKIIDPTVANGYEFCNDLREDILNALKHYANSIIVSESENKWNEMYEKCDPDDPNWHGGGYYYDDDGPMMSVDMMAEGAQMDMQEPSAPSLAAGAAAKEKEDSFDTNNQVEGVDEGDIAKSDGNYVYAAYGDLIYVWNATDGTQGVSITKMPQEKDDESCTSQYTQGKEEMENSNDDEAFQSVEASASSTTSSSSGGEETRRNRNRRRQAQARSFAPDMYWDPCFKPKPRILSLLLEGSRLTAIVSKEENRRYHYHKDEKDDEPDPIIDDSTKLIIRVYDVSSVPTDGSPLPLLGEREIKGNFNSARSVNNTGFVISTSYIDTWQFGNDLYRSDSQYCGLNTTEYVKLAAETALNNTEPFMERMVEELQLELDDGTKTCKNIFQLAAMQGGNSTEDQTNGNLLSQFVQVLSFDMSDDFESKVIPADVAGAFSSGWLQSVYASQQFAATVNVGSSYDVTTGNWEQSSFILGFDISSDTGPEPFCYAEVQGQPLNEYSLDLFEGHLRVVTTEWNWRWSDTEESRTLNKIVVLKVPGENGGQEMLKVAETGHIGKPNESVRSVRFIQDKAYIVTFETMDPFYIFDLSDPTSPEKMGELEIPGFSSYLHPIEIDGVPLMLGVGEHANETTGRTTGLKISLFDISDPTSPTENATFIDEGAYSSAGNDYKSFRYLKISQKLILPKSEYTWSEKGNFDGFVVYNVGVNKIAPTYEIQHASSYDMYRGCWYNAYMPARSFVFQSKLTTILSHSVISTDLENGDKLWNMSLDEGLNNTRCAPYFFGWD